MDHNALGKYTISFGLSLAVTSLLSAVLVVVKELNQSTILAWMKATTGHHWVTHGVFDILVFVILGLLLSRVQNRRGPQISAGMLSTVIICAVVVSGLLIAGFYLIEG